LKNCPQCAQALIYIEIGGKERLACPSGHCDFVHWDNPKPVTATLIPTQTGIVLVKRKFEPFVDDWCLPGGFIEATEHPEESAQREVYEETGLTVKIEKLLGAASPGHGINVIILFYLATPTGGLLAPGDDASDARTFHKYELPANICFELHRRMIRDFFTPELAR
jgi:ADP-ribose pyrophosphatase YjhB (NUDIX family)